MLKRFGYGNAIKFLLIGFLTAHAGEPETAGQPPRRMKAKGISKKAYAELIENRILAPETDPGVASCSMNDDVPFNTMYVLSDAAIIGRIDGIEYLYKEGGKFRTLYTIGITQTLKGGPRGSVKVFSPYGPNSRDHRRWRRHPSRIEYEIGDQGIFLLDTGIVADLRTRYPGEGILNLGGYTFSGNLTTGIYLLDGTQLDPKYMKAAKSADAGLTLAKAKSSAASINRILEAGKE